MTTARKFDLISVRDYLRSELDSPVKREYLSGLVYPRPDECNAHNIIKGNALAWFHARIRGHCFWPFDSNTKIRLRLQTGTRFYYPDGAVVGRPNSQRETFQDEPVLVLEVLSKATRRIDEVEKKDAYLSIPSLFVYMLVEQDAPAVVLFRRTERGFVREVYEGIAAVIPLNEIKTELPLTELYATIEFVPEEDEGER